MKPDGTLVAIWSLVIVTFFGLVYLGRWEPAPAKNTLTIPALLTNGETSIFVDVEINVADIPNMLPVDLNVWRILFDAEVLEETEGTNWTEDEALTGGDEILDLPERWTERMDTPEAPEAEG